MTIFFLRFYSAPNYYSEVKMLKQVVLRTDFSVDLKLLSVNQWFSRKVEGKKVKFFLARRQVKFYLTLGRTRFSDRNRLRVGKVD